MGSNWVFSHQLQIEKTLQLCKLWVSMSTVLSCVYLNRLCSQLVKSHTHAVTHKSPSLTLYCRKRAAQKHSCDDITFADTLSIY